VITPAIGRAIRVLLPPSRLASTFGSVVPIVRGPPIATAFFGFVLGVAILACRNLGACRVAPGFAQTGCALPADHGVGALSSRNPRNGGAPGFARRSLWHWPRRA
jgi:hypothetical protein